MSADVLGLLKANDSGLLVLGDGRGRLSADAPRLCVPGVSAVLLVTAVVTVPVPRGE